MANSSNSRTECVYTYVRVCLLLDPDLFDDRSRLGSLGVDVEDGVKVWRADVDSQVVVLHNFPISHQDSAALQ